MKIKYVEWGLANNFGTHIELHKDLKKFPRLHYAILQHELAHTKKTFTWHDFFLDFFPNPRMDYSELRKFMLKRPKTWIQLLPIYYQKGKGIVWDLNMIIIYIIMFIVIYYNVIMFTKLFL